MDKKRQISCPNALPNPTFNLLLSGGDRLFSSTSLIAPTANQFLLLLLEQSPTNKFWKYTQMIIIIRKPATTEQLNQMAETFWGLRIKLVVDVAREILAGGSELHYECEQVLLEDGSRQQDLWGADWYPETKEVTFESLINIRPSQQNRGMEITDPILREKIEIIVRRLLENN